MITPELRGLVGDLSLALMASYGLYCAVMTVPPKRKIAPRIAAGVFFLILAINAYGDFRTGY